MEDSNRGFRAWLTRSVTGAVLLNIVASILGVGIIEIVKYPSERFYWVLFGVTAGAILISSLGSMLAVRLRRRPSQIRFLKAELKSAFVEALEVTMAEGARGGTNVTQ